MSLTPRESNMSERLDKILIWDGSDGLYLDDGNTDVEEKYSDYAFHLEIPISHQSLGVLLDVAKEVQEQLGDN